MAEITVNEVAPKKYEVTVKAGTTTNHVVTLEPPYFQRLTTGKKVTPEHLIERSFHFLLARESNTMIMEQFDLPIISRYFPEYEGVIGVML